MTTPKPPVYKTLPTEHDFWLFVAKRHEAWHKRFVERTDPPWSDDKVISGYHFTNMYRELDRGTVWWRQQIGERVIPFIDKLWFTIIYRLTNSVEMWQNMGRMPSRSEWIWPTYQEPFLEQMHQLRKEGRLPYSYAYIVLPQPLSMDNKVDRLAYVLARLQPIMQDLAESVRGAQSLEEVWKLLCAPYGLAAFTAYEIVCDLAITKDIPFTLDDWVNVGPGARDSIKLFSEYDASKPMADYIKKLRFDQPHCFMGIEWHPWNGEMLNLRNVEHSLCEFRKYWNMRNKTGKRRMSLKAHDDWLPLGEDGLPRLDVPQIALE